MDLLFPQIRKAIFARSVTSKRFGTYKKLAWLIRFLTDESSEFLLKASYFLTFCIFILYISSVAKASFVTTFSFVG